jgi:hypothetical protein
LCRLSDDQTNSHTQKLELFIDGKEGPGEYAKENIGALKVKSKRSPGVPILENERKFGTCLMRYFISLRRKMLMVKVRTVLSV